MPSSEPKVLYRFQKMTKYVLESNVPYHTNFRKCLNKNQDLEYFTNFRKSQNMKILNLLQKKNKMRPGC